MDGLTPLPPTDEWLPRDPSGEFDDTSLGRLQYFSALIHALERTARWLGLPDRLTVTLDEACSGAVQPVADARLTLGLIDQLRHVKNGGRSGYLLAAVQHFRRSDRPPSTTARAVIGQELGLQEPGE